MVVSDKDHPLEAGGAALVLALEKHRDEGLDLEDLGEGVGSVDECG